MRSVFGHSGLGAIGIGGWRWLAFFTAILVAWTVLFAMGTDVPVPEGAALFGVDYWRSLCSGSARDASLPALFGMWALMSAAMMAPTAVPAFKTYDDLTHTGAGNALGFPALIGGYGALWLVYAAFGAGAQAALGRAGLVDPAGQSLAPWLNAALLAAAGAYQFSSFKEACLSQCRRPLVFFMSHWRPGAGGAFAMGLQLGAVCVGCCWALMLLAFVGGTMNLMWMGLATVLMTLEKLPEIGRWVTRPLGATLLAGALAMAARAAELI